MKRKKATFTCLLAVLILTPDLPARWAYVKPAKLLQSTDMIIVGRLHDIDVTNKEGFDHGKGTLDVVRAVFPASLSEEHFTLVWKNKTGLICPRVDPTPYEDQLAIWLLTLSEPDIVHADYPGRTLYVKDLAWFVSEARKDLGADSLDQRICALERFLLSPEMAKMLKEES